MNHTQVPAITLGPQWAIFCRERIVRRLLPTIRVRGFISRYLLSPCHEILSQPLITGFCFLSPPWPFVHWQCSGGGNQEPGWLMVTSSHVCPLVSILVTSEIAIPRHDLFWSTRFCISWHWIHAVHCGLRLNVSPAFYGHRAKVPRLHIVNDNLKGISNSAEENIFSLTKHFAFDSRRVISSLVPLSRLRVKLICNTAHIWVVLGSRLENWAQRENRINLRSYQNLLLPGSSWDPSSSISLTTAALNLSSYETRKIGS